MSAGSYGSLTGGGAGAVGAVLERVQDALFALASCLPCSAAASSTLKLNGRQYEVVRLLGEGGFSFVYLVRDKTSGREFALKKIRCALGSDTFREALREIDATKRFRSPHIIRLYDSAIVQDGEGKLIYLFLPFYPRGNVQDAINAHTVRGSRFGEKEMLTIFLGACRAVETLHRYRLPNVQVRGHISAPSAASETTLIPSQSNDAVAPPSHADDDDENDLPKPTGPMVIRPGGADAESDGEAAAPLIAAEDEAATYPPPPHDAAKRVSDETEGQQSSVAQVAAGGEMAPYAHRDLKPGNIMLADDGTPLLYDFGSTLKARRPITSRRAAVAEQDLAAEQSSMPYRAPELFDVKTNTTITEAVDIWSLGCVLFAMAYLHSPFETDQTVGQGGSLALAVLNGDYKLPAEGTDLYSNAAREIIQRCLTLDPAGRPDIEELIRLTGSALRSLA